ncbi:DUF4139 domain-containing protein [Planomicrobium sp. CPCC 101079]|uniref:DUF4139 domain-containing protein n=1 Tax=Planomicrobium sp. CPCC 101079 TaxID=2599618 RepID=UPI0011B68C2A|nr:DUF4139 domain-containing protein [Planomicrobium sp. CPCC 101079]TWT02416.1 DUF4139 domain-containing protein [Planomicrobium sp. CPCC 101079]
MKYQSTSEERVSLSLTIYQSGFGMVKEVRQIATKDEISEIYFKDIAKGIAVDSVLVKGLNMLEQDYIHNSISKTKLLENYIGREVTVRNHDTGKDIQIILISSVDGLIGERQDTKEVIIDPEGELIVPSIPKSLSAKPVLFWKVVPGKTDEHIKVSYITQGIEWRVNYIMEIEGTALQLTGWMEIRNDTGTDFSDAAVKLMAREVYRQTRANDFSLEPRMYENSAKHPQVEEYDFRDQPAYKLERSVTLLDGQTKQIPFLEAHVASFRTVYEVDKWSEQARVKLEFANKKTNGLGMPLLKGTVKLYELDADKELEFIGEDAIAPLAVEEVGSIRIGEAFDITCKSNEKKRWKKEGVEYVTHSYALTNRKEENARIHINHFMNEPVWEMESSSHDYEIKNTGHIMFVVRAAGKKEVPVEFTYRVDRE